MEELAYFYRFANVVLCSAWRSQDQRVESRGLGQPQGQVHCLTVGIASGRERSATQHEMLPSLRFFLTHGAQLFDLALASISSRAKVEVVYAEAREDRPPREGPSEVALNAQDSGMVVGT